MKPKCILFAGAPGSSKTPVAIYLSWNLGLPVFNNDVIRIEVSEDTLRRSPSPTDDPEFVIRQKERIFKLFESRKSFICDFSVDKNWPGMKEVIDQYGYDYFLISFNYSREFIQRIGKVKGYPDNENNVIWYDLHADFINKYGKDINLVIDEDNFSDRLEIALNEVSRFMGNIQYKHFKGGIYEIVCEAIDSENMEELIVYKNVKTGETWVRPKNIFFENVEIDGKIVPRFEKLKDK